MTGSHPGWESESPYPYGALAACVGVAVRTSVDVSVGVSAGVGREGDVARGAAVAVGADVAVGAAVARGADVAVEVDVTTGKGVVWTRVRAEPGAGVLVQVGVKVGRSVGTLVSRSGAVGSARGARTYAYSSPPAAP